MCLACALLTATALGGVGGAHGGTVDFEFRLFAADVAKGVLAVEPHGDEHAVALGEPFFVLGHGFSEECGFVVLGVQANRQNQKKEQQ